MSPLLLFLMYKNLFLLQVSGLKEIYPPHTVRKRYAIFPEGSTFTVAICVTLKLMTPDYDIFTEAVNWALTYDLPENVDDYNKHLYGPSLPIQARRKRSSFFRKIEVFIENAVVNLSPWWLGIGMVLLMDMFACILTNSFLC